MVTIPSGALVFQTGKYKTAFEINKFRVALFDLTTKLMRLLLLNNSFETFSKLVYLEGLQTKKLPVHYYWQRSSDIPALVKNNLFETNCYASYMNWTCKTF